MEDILESLGVLRYDGPVNNVEALQKAIDGGATSVEFTGLVSWLSDKLRSLNDLDERVHPTSGHEDADSFYMELAGLLRELACPYTSLTEGPVSSRLSDAEARITLLLFLTSEAEASVMIAVNKPKKAIENDLNESETAKNLRELLQMLQLSKPPPNITPAQLFSKLHPKLKDLVNKAPPQLIGKPLLTMVLTEKQWWNLHKLYEEMMKEYQLRREMLLKRVDVTIQSFTWSERLKGKENEMAAAFQPIRQTLLATPSVQICDMLAAREDLAVLEKTSSAKIRKNTQSSVTKVIIGQVPDRGGRPYEQKPPPPEMPSWQKRQPGHGGGRGGGDFSRGGRVQGGWNQGGDWNQREDQRSQWNQNSRGGRGGWGRGGRGGRGGGGGRQERGGW